MKSKALSILFAAAVLGVAGSAAAFELSSPDIKPNSAMTNKFVFKGFGCDGENVSPALTWKAAPKGAKSFALLVHDPDAPTGGAGWWHWVVYNIPADVGSLPQGAGKGDGSAMVKGAVQNNTDFGAPGWGGPCPPAGDKPHHYHFTLYAVKVDKLDLPQGATASLAAYMINANSIGKARLTGIYGRKK